MDGLVVVFLPQFEHRVRFTIGMALRVGCTAPCGSGLWPGIGDKATFFARTATVAESMGYDCPR
jgi:hypothetical protein